MGLCIGLMSNYSKTFGLTFINDDHFFASIAIVQNVFNGSCRIFWGFFYDKAGFKVCFLFIGFIVTAITALLPVLTFIGKNINKIGIDRVKPWNSVKINLSLGLS